MKKLNQLVAILMLTLFVPFVAHATEFAATIENAAQRESAQQENDERALLKAARDGDLTTVRYYVNVKKTNIETDRGGLTPLMYAAEEGHMEIVRFLVKEAKPKADVKKRNRFGSALEYAVMDKHWKIAEFLIDNGADPRIADESMGRKMTIAYKVVFYEGGVEADRLSLLKKLIKMGVDMEEVSFGNNTPLMAAAFDGNYEAVKLLVKQGKVNLFFKNENGETALDKAKWRVRHGSHNKGQNEAVIEFLTKEMEKAQQNGSGPTQTEEWMQRALNQLNQGASREYRALGYTINDFIYQTELSTPADKGYMLGVLDGYVMSTLRNKDVEIAQKLRDEYFTTADGREVTVLDILEKDAEKWFSDPNDTNHTAIKVYAEYYGHFTNRVYYGGALLSMYNSWDALTADLVSGLKEGAQAIRDLAEGK